MIHKTDKIIPINDMNFKQFVIKFKDSTPNTNLKTVGIDTQYNVPQITL